MTCSHPNWRSATWVLRSSLERLHSLPALTDLRSFHETLDRISELVTDLAAPAEVLEAWHRLGHAVREREEIAARAARVRHA